MKDIQTELDQVLSIAAAVYTDDNTEVSVDLQGYDAALVELSVGVGGITFTTSNKIEFKLTHSDDDVSYDAVTAADLVGEPTVGTGGIILSFTSAKAAASVHKFGYIGNKRYLQLLADFSGTHGTGTAIAAHVLKGHGRLKPPVGE